MPLEPPVALFVFANPPPGHPDHLRNLTAEVERLRLHGEALRDRLGIEARFEADTTPAHLLRLLTDPELASRVVALHYAGHADPERWLLAGIDGEGASAHAAGFIELLDRLPALRLVVLNGCSTAAQARAIALRGPAVVGTDAAIRDDAALLFADWLHRGLARGQTVHTAFDEAQAAVVTQLGEPGATRMLRPAAAEPQSVGPAPWRLVTSTAEAGSWRLADAIDDPLAALPQLPARPLTDSPYRHVQRFTGDHAEVFFGRGHDIRRLYERLTADDAPPVVLLYGASGVGKSSLLEAGIGPRLRADDRWMRVQRYDPSAPLLDGLGRCLRMASGMPSEPSGMPSEPSGEPSDAIRWVTAEAEAGGPIVAVLDQVEEALIAADGRDDVLDALLKAVAGAFAGPSPPKGRLVLSFRKGYVAEVSDALARFGLAASRVFVKPLDRAAVIGIVTGPTRRRRLRDHFQLELAPGLAERIADDVTAGQPAAVAPILQILLTRMWGRPVQRPVRFDGALYDRVRREGVGLAEVFGRQLAEAEVAGDAGHGLLLDLLECHTTARGTSYARDAAAVEDRYPGATRPGAVQAAIDARLLARWQGHGPEGGQGTRLAHDVWGPLVLDAFHSSERPGQRARRILENRVVDGVDAAALDAHDLGRVVEGLSGMRAPTPAEDDLIARSQIEVEAAARRARKVRWTGNILVGLLVVFGFVLVGKQLELEGALEDVTRARDAERKSGNAARRNAAQSRADARRAEAALARMRDETWMRMVVAHEDDPSVAAAALREVSRHTRDATWHQAVLDVLSEPIAYHWLPAPANDVIGIDRRGRLWLDILNQPISERAPAEPLHRLRPGERAQRLDPWSGALAAMALPPGWRSIERLVRSYDVRGPDLWTVLGPVRYRSDEGILFSPRAPTMRGQRVPGLGAHWSAISPSGSWLADDTRGTIRLWHLPLRAPVERGRIATLPLRVPVPAPDADVGLDPSGRWFYALLADGSLRAWDLEAQRLVLAAVVPTGSAARLRVSSEGALISILRGGATQHLWMQHGIGDIGQTRSESAQCAVSSGLDDRIVVSFDDDGAPTAMWIGRPGPVRLIGHELDILAAAFARQGPLFVHGRVAALVCEPRASAWSLDAVDHGFEGGMPAWAREGALGRSDRIFGPGGLIASPMAANGEYLVAVDARPPLTVRAGSSYPPLVRFDASGDWLTGVVASGVIYRWPVTLAAADIALRGATVGCLPPHLRRAYFSLSALEAEEAWRRCERGRGREPLPLR